MDKSEVVYQGRIVPKEGFRVFIYGRGNKKKLVNSWMEFEVHKATGDWFETEEEAKEPVLKEPVAKGESVKDDAPVPHKKKGKA